MLSPPHVCDLSSHYRLLDTSEELSAAEVAESDIEPTFLERFDEGPLRFFEPLQAALPSCFQVIQDAEMRSCLVVDDGMPGVVIIQAAFELNNRLVVASPTETWMRGEHEWGESIACVPEPLRCFHAFHFNGLHTTWEPGLQMATSLGLNLPGAIFKWSNVEHYRSDHRLHHKKFAVMKRKLGDLQNIRIWIQSDWGDLILLNQNTQDQRLYHVRGHDFDHFPALTNPVSTVDRYCAHVLKGVTAPFDFQGA